MTTPPDPVEIVEAWLTWIGVEPKPSAAILFENLEAAMPLLPEGGINYRTLYTFAKRRAEQAEAENERLQELIQAAIITLESNDIPPPADAIADILRGALTPTEPSDG